MADDGKRGKEKIAILYLTYDGLLEPLGQSQILAYQMRLTDEFEVHILSFEKPETEVGSLRENMAGRLEASGISWHPFRYHKKPSAIATAWDILVGTLNGFRLVRKHNIRIVHARSYVPAVMALALKKLEGVKFVFDMRGFWADERVDGGLWPHHGVLFKIAKWFEKQFLLHADHVVSLTRSALLEMKTFSYLKSGMPPTSVIPTCVDLELFIPSYKFSSDMVLGYVGSVGMWYLFTEVVSFFSVLKKRIPSAKLLVLNLNGHGYIRDCLGAAGVSASEVEIISVEHSEVPAQMARMTMGAFFIKPVYSKIACSPTKLGEFLACGIPCVSNKYGGDMAGLLESERVGVVLQGFSREALESGVDNILALLKDPGLRERCINAAHNNFELEIGVKSYRRIYSNFGTDSKP